ncbi:hypothetical protein [Flavobacterium ardleyense]|uniref:hypothetical protein n=1 Tax=Flavobacterium ardleyense TaxID=2038737 RepID=UPI00298CF9CB|nr:hypothetical protein [Flavobacterium ardleyense]
MKYSIVLISCLLLTSCGARVKANITDQRELLTIDDKVAFLEVKHAVPQSAKKVGSAKFGDSGVSTDCNYDSNLVKARKIARANGANIVKIIEVKTPDLWSSCHRMKIDFYYYDGDVSQLAQTQIQIK